MSTFKQTDCWISTGLIVLCTIITVSTWSVSWLFRSYFIIGGWQSASMVVHVINGWFIKKGGDRYIYHGFIIGIFCTALPGLIIPPLFMILLYVLLIISPVLAVSYTLICYDETQALKQRHALNLK